MDRLGGGEDTGAERAAAAIDARRGSLSNAEIRQIARLDRYPVVRVMKELQHEDPAVVREGVGKGSRYRYLPGGSERRGL